MTAESVPETRMPLVALGGVIASVTVFGVAQGLSNPLFTFLMQKQGMSSGAIGLSAAMTPLGLMTSSLFVPALVRLFGARGLAVGRAASAAFLLLFVALSEKRFARYTAR
jgi:hypothetical protein